MAKMSELEEICNFADNCAVDSNKSGICKDKGGYVHCKIYQELIKYDKKYLCTKKNKIKEQWMIK